jgi:hypothetical protein
MGIPGRLWAIESAAAAIVALGVLGYLRSL